MIITLKLEINHYLLYNIFGDYMKTIINNYTEEIIIKNSRFITKLIKLTNPNEINNYLEETKKEYPKATHYCYAYRSNNYQKSSDDGEPGGTAGMPMLNILEKENIINVLAITIRYFGGIKLGAGGLVRAYAKSVRETIKEDNLQELIEGYIIEIETSYENQKDLEYILKNNKIISKDYSTLVKYQIEIEKNKLEQLDKYNPIIIKEDYIEKVPKY